jgi:hypothetical protein
MRRLVVLASALTLSGCAGSGFWDYLGDTSTFPGQNPNRPAGSSEVYKDVRHLNAAEPTPLLTEAGDVWPGPVTNIPTLRDMQKQQAATTSGAQSTDGITLAPGTTEGLGPLPPLPQLPGYEVTPPAPAKMPPLTAFETGRARTPSGANVPTTGSQNFQAIQPVPNGTMIGPNGNGTSTVIAPNGTVTTIPTPK